MKLKSEILAFFSRNKNSSFKANSILKKLRLRPSQMETLKKELRELVKENRITKEKKYYSLNYDTLKQKITGEVDFGKDGRIIIIDSDSKQHINILKNKEANTFRLNVGDKVEYRPVRSTDYKGETAAEILQVLNTGKKFITGKFENHQSYGLVFPDSREIKKEIIVSSDDFKNALDGDKVYLEILNPDDSRDEFSDLRGKIIEVLGKSGDRSTEEKSIMRKFNLVKAFPKDVEREAKSIEINYDINDRVDLRDKIIFTIDPEDAKDFDDAVSVEKNEDGTFILGVHIADVSHYVRENTPLDKEALRRATSVYLVKNVIPMLPEKLSNGVCSLRPNEDSLTFSIFITLTKRFALKSFEIKKSIINSKRRFSYEEAQNIIDTKKGDYAEELQLMYKMSKSITLSRLKDESLDFDSNEVRFTFTKKGEVDEIIVKERLESMRLIEEFMLLANKCATLYVKEISKKNEMHYPFIYRVHDIPNKEKMKELSEFVKQFGYTINPDDKNSLRKLLTEIKGKPEEFIINNLLIRSMAKAIYTTKNIGHYGLGFKDYTHFTSPIRRYPDLVVHRLLHEYIKSGKDVHKFTEHYKIVLPEICKQSSIMEQNAEQAERESIKLMQGEYISKHIGDVFEGIVSGIMQFGMFVEIMDILVEGMIRFRDIEDDYYEYDEKRHIAFGRRRHKVFQAGQKVKIKVIRVNKENKKIDFALV
ncbi:MAG TPA: ribonuclease R [Ignavibacteria bacterium]|nr:ribonuclease R [Ignavibacteria bacterium]